MIFALLQWYGTKPIISPRYARIKPIVLLQVFRVSFSLFPFLDYSPVAQIFLASFLDNDGIECEHCILKLYSLSCFPVSGNYNICKYWLSEKGSQAPSQPEVCNWVLVLVLLVIIESLARCLTVLCIRNNNLKVDDL